MNFRTTGATGRRLLQMSLLLLFATGASLPAGAEKQKYVRDKILVTKKPNKKVPPPENGWFPTLKAGLNLAFSQSQGVVGVVDGTTMSLGIAINGTLLMRKGAHEWHNVLNILHTQSKSPNLEPFIKAADKFEFESFYLYRFPRIQWLGVYGGIKLEAPLLAGYIVKDADTNVLLKNNDGTTTADRALAQQSFQLTKSLAPFTFKQYAGVSMRPVNRSYLNLEIKVAGGATEVWNRGGYAVSDDAATPELDLVQLKDYVQAGAQLRVEMGGATNDKLLSYLLKGELMYPFVTSVDTAISGIDLLNTELSFNLNVKLSSWASLTYSISVNRLPMILNKWQVTNNLMLSITASLVKSEMGGKK